MSEQNDAEAMARDAASRRGAEARGLDTGLLGLAMIAAVHQKVVEPAQLSHELGLRSGQTASTRDLLRSALRIGLKARRTRLRAVAKLNQRVLPALVKLKDGRYGVLAAVSAPKALLQIPGEAGPRELYLTDLEELWTGEAILITSRVHGRAENRPFNVRWFLPSLWKYGRIFREVLIASAFLQLFALVTPLFFQLVIDKVLVHRGLTTLDVLVIGLAALSIFEVVLTILRTYTFAHTTSRVDVELGARLFRHLMSLPISYFEARQTGQTVARVRELDTIRDFLTSSALTLVIDLVFTVIFFVVMWLYSPTLTLIVLASIPAYVILSAAVTPVLRARIEERFNRGAENQTFLVESVVGVETLKAMAVEPQMQRRWEDQLAGYVRASFKTIQLGNVAQNLAQLINKIVIALTLWFGARAVIAGDLTVGQLIAFNMIAGRVAMPILRLAQLWQDFQQARVAVERLGDILNAPREVRVGARSELPSIVGRVTFDHVTFRYRPGGPEVLADVSLDVPPGQVVGVVGPSGSGKSTLAKLVQRLHAPERGRVLIDGVDLAQVDPAWLRRQVGVVLQENVLFRRSVRENIALADPGLSIERVIAAAKLAGAHEFILGLPQGYDTIIEERGANLSGGQRQRIAIARALITNPRILIFDEATSALDYESERAIQENMAEIVAGRSVIIIAHRLAAVRRADRIITVEAGRIAEDGSHEELLRRGGRYASLYAMQFADRAPGPVGGDLSGEGR